MFYKNSKKAFTLVELIVVITILAILGTIAFLSFTSYSASARDSVRISDMTNISKWLTLMYAKWWKYISPDNSVNIMLSWAIVNYQWFAWARTLSTIWLSSWWKDPKDGSYYTYTTNSSQDKYELLGFLEDKGNVNLSYNPFWYDKTAAASTDYSDRFVHLRWDWLWILLSSWTLTPVQTSWTWVELTTSWSGYSLYLDDKNSTSWTWASLVTTFALSNKQVASQDSSLVGFWKFDEWNWTTVSDSSIYNHTWTFAWSPSWVAGRSWWGLKLSAWNYVRISAIWAYDNFWSSSFSVSAWFKWNTPWAQSCIASIAWSSQWWRFGYSWNLPYYLYWDGSNYYEAGVWSKSVTDGNWHNITINYLHDAQMVSAYVDWALVWTWYTSITWSANIASWLFIGSMSWWSGWVDWVIDELRIYSKPLSDFEIKALYDWIN